MPAEVVRRAGSFADVTEMKTVQETILELARSRGVLRAALVAIGPENGKLKISTPAASYESAYTGKEGLEVNAITLAALVKKFDLQTIHLLKSNIEGAERYLFENENGFAPGRIKNIAIACHDFRFKKEKNDFFQTKEKIKTALGKAGFEIHQRNTGIDYLDDWIYGSAKFS